MTVKKILFAAPIALALSGFGPAIAADDAVLMTLLNRIQALSEENTRLTIDNQRLSMGVAPRDNAVQARPASPTIPKLLTPEQATAQKAAANQTINLPVPTQQQPSTPGIALQGNAVQLASGPSPSADMDPKQFDALMREWVKTNAGYIFASVNTHLAEQQQANQPKVADFAARASELFEKDAVTAGAEGANAKVRMVVFADYNCRYCKEMQPVVDRLISKNPELQVVYRDLPILSPTSRLAAQAGRAAERQGKYAEFHKELYRLTQIDEKSILDLGAKLNLDVEKLKADMTSPEIASLVTNDLNLGESLKIQGTPFFYIEGAERTYPGAAPEGALQDAITKLRNKKA
ncbi:DsbA family protein [Azospirillum sp. SYSU D00513]|uniref:DsbA family protein n=1 Tax=Azospirillum sp. SYSU D00513 TaxID=2812561 RepID=UPI001A978024|nr:DsbA family protein [Azospirillum sp. SYSU D00513]